MALKTNKLFDVSSKVALVTGASGFLGQEMASLFALNGATTLLVGRSEKVAKVADDISSQTGSRNVHVFLADLYDEKQRKKLVEDVRTRFEIDVLINNAYDMGPATGFNTEKGKLQNLDASTWSRAFESGLFWAFDLAQSFHPSLKKKKGSIINISSMYGVVSPDPQLYEGTDFFNPAPYGVMKSGLLALTRYLASFWAEDGIRCNAISPGPFSNTKTASQNAVKENDPFLDRVKNKTLLKRVGVPEELDGALLLLASQAGSYITGQNLIVDGGWTVV